MNKIELKTHFITENGKTLCNNYSNYTTKKTTKIQLVTCGNCRNKHRRDYQKKNLVRAK